MHPGGGRMSHNRKIAVIGLGYVGLPIAVAFGKKQKLVAFDINTDRIRELISGYDRNHDVSRSDLEGGMAEYTSDPCRLRDADFHIVAVPTPVDDAKRPDLTPLVRA